jgi:tetratricopeptide (TPR) repeat protein
LDGIDPSYQDFVGWVLAQMGRFTDALPYAERAVTTEPTNFDYHYNLAFTQDKLHQYRDLAASGQEMIRLQPKKAEGYAGVDWAQIGEWRFGSALGNFRRAHELDPDQPNYQRGLDEAKRKMWALYAGIGIVITLLVLRFRRWQQRRMTRTPTAETPSAQ